MADPKMPAPRPSRLWRIVLVISLALNLAVVGLVAGSAATGRFGEGPPRSFDLGLGPMARALDKDERRAIGRVMRQDRALRDFNLRGRVSGMVEALKAEPFEPDALRALMAEQASRVAQVQATAQSAFVDQIITMTPERRHAFADQLTQELSRARPARDRDRDEGSGG